MPPAAEPPAAAVPGPRSPWVTGGGSLHSANDPAGLTVDGTSHTRRPVDYLARTGPLVLRTTRPVPRVLRHGLLVVPDTIDALEPWSRLDLIVDVLRRTGAGSIGDLTVAGPTPQWDLRAGDGSGTWDTWIHRLEPPLTAAGMAWLHAHTLLPLDVRYFDSWYGEPGTPWLSDGVYVIR